LRFGGAFLDFDLPAILFLLLSIARFWFRGDFVQIAGGYRFGDLASCRFGRAATLLQAPCSAEKFLLGLGDLVTANRSFGLVWDKWRVLLEF
jgi:hypothetical protein